MTVDNDRALGAVLGAFVGDGAGATLEFLGRQPTSDEVDHALMMPGGGCWGVAPGQITDDSELALCLARALAEGSPNPLETTARWYRRWYDSPPFDIGGTTSNALSVRPQPDMADAMRARARELNMGSKANGSLMRCTPLALWGHRMMDPELAEIARGDSSLTHPNPSCGDAVAAYVIAIAALIRGESRDEAYSRAARWARADANADVSTWLNLAEADEAVPYHPHVGFVKIAFVHAMRHLLRGSHYVEALHETLLGGGDTDTNAAIVGGLVGAAVGASRIPQPMRAAVLEADTQAGRHRPDFLHPGDVDALADRLLAVAP